MFLKEILSGEDTGPFRLVFLLLNKKQLCLHCEQIVNFGKSNIGITVQTSAKTKSLM